MSEAMLVGWETLFPLLQASFPLLQAFPKGETSPGGRVRRSFTHAQNAKPERKRKKRTVEGKKQIVLLWQRVMHEFYE